MEPFDLEEIFVRIFDCLNRLNQLSTWNVKKVEEEDMVVIHKLAHPQSPLHSRPLQQPQTLVTLEREAWIDWLVSRQPDSQKSGAVNAPAGRKRTKGGVVKKKRKKLKLKKKVLPTKDSHVEKRATTLPEPDLNVGSSIDEKVDMGSNPIVSEAAKGEDRTEASAPVHGNESSPLVKAEIPAKPMEDLDIVSNGDPIEWDCDPYCNDFFEDVGDKFEIFDVDDGVDDEEVIRKPSRVGKSRPPPRDRRTPPPTKKKTIRPKKKDDDEDFDINAAISEDHARPKKKDGRPRKYPELYKISRDPNDGRFHCPRCDEGYQAIVGMIQHYQNRHARREFLCSICPAKFASKHSFEYHRELIHNDGGGKLSCQRCDMRFRYAQYLYRHVEAEHGIKKKPATKDDPLPKPRTYRIKDHFNCRHCFTTFPNYIAYQRHVYNDHQDLLTFCRGCMKPFLDEASLYLHVKKYHPTMDDLYLKCPCCKRRFVTESSLSYHVDENHEESSAGEEKPFLCPIPHCQKGFRLQTSMSIHDKVHVTLGKKNVDRAERRGRKDDNEGDIEDTRVVDADADIEKTQNASSPRDIGVASVEPEMKKATEKEPCTFCGELILKSNMTTHVWTYHEVACKECGQEFNHRYHLKKHVFTVHRKLQLPCPECGKTFGSRTLLKNHIRAVHSAPHQCHLCDKSFCLKHDLTSHVRGDHEGIKAHCSVCGKDFNRNSDRNRHEKDVHGLQGKGTPLKTVVDQ